MRDLPSDLLRLFHFGTDECPPGIDAEDIWKGTALGYSVRAEPNPKPRGPKELEKLEKKLNPIGSIERVSDVLIKHAKKLDELKRKKRGAPTRQKGAIPDSTINSLAWEMLVACNDYGLAPPVALLNLVRFQLGIRSNNIAKQESKYRTKRREASLMAYRTPDASFREIAHHIDVNVSTVARWNKQFDLRVQGKVIHEASENTRRASPIFIEALKKYLEGHTISSSKRSKNI